MRIGYARVSAGDQTLDLQADALTSIGCDKVITDVLSGAKAERPGLEDAIDYYGKEIRWWSGGSIAWGDRSGT
jgi:DNA invertase Pin-like site-specific DNA recombinase